MSKHIIVISKRYNDTNGNLKYSFNIFNNLGDCINKEYYKNINILKKSKNGLISYSDNFRQISNNKNFIIIDLTNL